MGDVFLAEIRDLDRPVGGVGDEDRTEGVVAGAQREPAVGGGKGGAVAPAVGGHHMVVERVDGEEGAAPAVGQGGALNDAEHMGEARDRVGAFHHWQLTEGERIGGGPEFAGVLALFEKEAVLDVVPAAGVTAVVAAVEAPFGVE